MTSPLSPEAVAQMVADVLIARLKYWGEGFLIKDTELGRYVRSAADMLTTLAAENATLRAENEELDFLRHEGGPDSVAAMEIELATLRASEAAAVARVTELEAVACSYQAALLRQGIDGSKGPKE